MTMIEVGVVGMPMSQWLVNMRVRAGLTRRITWRMLMLVIQVVAVSVRVLDEFM